LLSNSACTAYFEAAASDERNSATYLQGVIPRGQRYKVETLVGSGATDGNGGDGEDAGAGAGVGGGNGLKRKYLGTVDTLREAVTLRNEGTRTFGGSKLLVYGDAHRRFDEAAAAAAADNAAVFDAAATNTAAAFRDARAPPPDEMTTTASGYYHGRYFGGAVGGCTELTHSEKVCVCSVKVCVCMRKKLAKTERNERRENVSGFNSSAWFQPLQLQFYKE
jgi:hypothetical protein